MRGPAPDQKYKKPTNVHKLLSYATAGLPCKSGFKKISVEAINKMSRQAVNLTFKVNADGKIKTITDWVPFSHLKHERSGGYFVSEWLIEKILEKQNTEGGCG